MNECKYCGGYHEEEADGLFSGIPWPSRCVDPDDIRERQLYDALIEDM